MSSIKSLKSGSAQETKVAKVEQTNAALQNSETTAQKTNQEAKVTQANAASKNIMTTTTSTSRSLTVEKTVTTFKKKCWTELKDNTESTTFKTLEMCRRNGYDMEGLYEVPEFTRLLNTLNLQQVKMASRISYPTDYSLSIRDGDTYDVVIVGCGAAGSTLAGKLSNEKDLNVLVLEAGGTPSLQSEIPGLWANSIKTEMDWKYRAESDDTFGQGLDQNRVQLIRGKCLGGTTALNTMLYDRGLSEDYTKFEQAGLLKWSWEDVIKYYKRSEDCKFEKITTNETVSTHHSKGGKLTVDSFRNKRTVKIRQVYSQALTSVNYTTSDFHDVKNHRGFVSSVAIVDKGLRVNAAKAYLKNADRKYNLKISARSLVKRVLFDDSKRATGVEFVNSVGETVRVNCTKYVVLSAGPIGTPALLMRSGVGPSNVLGPLNIPVVLNNDRVGTNLQAHPNFLGVLVRFEGQPIKSSSVSEMVFEYLTKYTGPLATIGLCSFTGFIDVDGNGTPDVQIFLHYYSEDDTVFMPSQLDAFNFGDSITDQIIDVNDEADCQIVGVSLLRPKNKGSVSIGKVTDEDDYEEDDGLRPVIKFGSLAEEDVNTLVKAVEWVKNVIRSESLKRFEPTIVPLKFEDGPEPNVDSEQYWRHAIKHMTTMNVQMTGTASMAVEQSQGVINEDLEVFGVEKLMVVDSSALPIMFTGESCAPSMMVAEKACDMIKQKLGYNDDDDDENDEVNSLKQ